jgi:hypothetical protein
MNNKIQYITTDLEFESAENLDPIVQELGDSIVTQLNQWVDGKYRVSLSGTGSELNFVPEQTINEFCDAIESLSASSQALWNGCINRVADIAFESGSDPNQLTYHLSANLISRLERLKIGLAITIYPIGTYNYENTNKAT